jgi:hypothetical protein
MWQLRRRSGFANMLMIVIRQVRFLLDRLLRERPDVFQAAFGKHQMAA